MSQVNNSRLVIMILIVGTVIGVLRGSEARQKWVFKIKNRFVEKKQLAEQKRLVRSGGVVLDEVELKTFHS